MIKTQANNCVFFSSYFLSISYKLSSFTHNFEDLGGGDGVKVRELIADLAPEHAARLQRDVTQSDQPGATGRLLKRRKVRGLFYENRNCFQ